MIKARPIILIVTVFILCFFPVTSMAENEPGTIKWKYPLQESPVRTPAIGHNNITDNSKNSTFSQCPIMLRQ